MTQGLETRDLIGREVSSEGSFRIGDAVSCIDGSGRELARGLCAYPAEAVIVGVDCKVYMTPKAKKLIRWNVDLVDGKLPNCKP